MLPDKKPADEVARIVYSCPTGALKFIKKFDSGAFYIIDHTGIYDNARGKGVEKGLVSTFVEHALAEGKQVLPLCPFAKGEFDKNPDYQDVLKT